MKTIKVGVMSYEDMKARTMAIARGELKPGKGDPKLWVPSTETLGKILSGANRSLLREIRLRRPGSLRELSRATGRAESNLSRTLHAMERYGLVRLNKVRGQIEPRVDFDRLLVELDLVDAAPRSRAVERQIA